MSVMHGEPFSEDSPFCFLREGVKSMPEEPKEVWCGKELERLAMEPGTIVVVKEAVTNEAEREPVPAETGVSPSEGGTAPLVGNTD